MSAPFEDPTDQYRTDGADPLSQPVDYGQYSSYQQQAPGAPMVPYTPAALPAYEQQEARRERTAITVRTAIALVMAIPLTAIAANVMGASAGGFGALLGIAMTWLGVAVVVYLSHGKGFPYPRS